MNNVGKSRWHAVLILSLLAGSAGAAEDAAWFFDGEVTVIADDNVSRADRTRDIVEDESVLANVAVAWNKTPRINMATTLRGFVETEVFDTVDTLNRSSVGAQVMLRWQPHRGYTAPIYQLSLASQLDDYDVDQRDSTVYTVQAFASRRVTDRIMASYGLEGMVRDSDGTVFDLRQARLFLNGDYRLGEHWSAYGTYSFLKGDTFSTAQFSFCNGVPANDIYGLVAYSEAVESDEAFNRTFCGSWLAYRLEADTHSLTLGLNRGLGHRFSIDVSAQQVRVEAEGDNYYRRTLLRAGLLARF